MEALILLPAQRSIHCYIVSLLILSSLTVFLFAITKTSSRPFCMFHLLIPVRLSCLFLSLIYLSSSKSLPSAYSRKFLPTSATLRSATFITNISYGNVTMWNIVTVDSSFDSVQAYTEAQIMWSESTTNSKSITFEARDMATVHLAGHMAS